MPLIILAIRKLHELTELIFQIGDKFQSFGHTWLAKHLIEVKQTQGTLGSLISGVPVVSVLFPTNDCPFGYTQKT